MPRPPAIPEQLPLFDGSPFARARPRPRRRRRRTGLRALLTVLALGVATAGIMAGSYAAWTAQTTNPSNNVAAGTIGLTNDKAGVAVISASDVVPGDSGSQTVTLTNSGNVPLAVYLTQDNVSSSGIEASLGLKVYDQSRDHCYWPVDQPGACPAGYGAWDAAGTLATKPLPATSGAARWPVGEAHTFTIFWELSASSPNSDQGKAGSFQFVWDGTS